MSETEIWSLQNWFQNLITGGTFLLSQQVLPYHISLTNPSYASCFPRTLTVQVPNVLSSDAHVLTLTKCKITLVAAGTARVEPLLTCL